MSRTTRGVLTILTIQLAGAAALLAYAMANVEPYQHCKSSLRQGYIERHCSDRRAKVPAADSGAWREAKVAPP